jgi:Gluconate 2-dehydrogenase subunit 3
MGTTILYGDFPAVVKKFNANGDAVENTTAAFFSDEELQLTQLIIETMLPSTDLPATFVVRVLYFVELVIEHCFDSSDKQLIRNGLQQFNEQAGRKFFSLLKEEQVASIRQLQQAALKGVEDKTWFLVFKKLMSLGYFASKDGVQKALQYVKVPGENNGSVPYSTGDNIREKIYLMHW